MRWLARSAAVSKYTHHIAMLPRNEARKAATVVAFHEDPAKVAPVTRIDSPSAMITNRPQRSDRWPPSMSHSVVLERPSPGTRNATEADTYSTAMASIHKTVRSGPSSKPPQIQNTAEARNHTRMRMKLRNWARLSLPNDHSMNSIRPTCMAANTRPKTAPMLANASGIEDDSSSPPSIRPNSRRRTGIFSGSSQLVNHEVKIHSHH